MQAPQSPLFPALQLTLAQNGTTTPTEGQPALMPQLPDKPLVLLSSIEVYIIPAELNLFVQGFASQEYADRPPTLLRGCLFVRILKPTKLKSISLTFKGQERTDWPEGIPPKKNTFVEVNDIVSHTWPFFQQESLLPNCGADIYRPASKSADQEVSFLTLEETATRSHSPMPDTGNFFTRNLSPMIKRAPSPGLVTSDSFSDLSTVLTAPDNDASKPGHFAAGDYVYNFEHPIHPSIAETTSVTFGCVNYHLEASIIRVGTFKLNITCRLPIDIIRVLSEDSQEENEPIVITRDWEDQLLYDIVVGGKSIVLNSYLPLAFKFVPLWGKVALHRIRVYLTENIEYYCNNKKVHRMEPSKKFLLLEHKALKGKSLLSKNGGMTETTEDDDEVLPRELEFQLYVPQHLRGKLKQTLHPDTSFENIKVHHWIKMCLRISKSDPDIPDKRKHYEILIDSPLHILSPLAAHSNTLLPAYDMEMNNLWPTYSPGSPPLSPDVTAVDNSNPQGIMSLFVSHGSNPNQSSSLDTVMAQLLPVHPILSQSMIPSRVHSRATTPIEFRHISTTFNNGEPIEREADMHLDANLYQPTEDLRVSPLNSPQATPHPGTFNAIHSPIPRPIHLIRRPSFNPPPFEADVAPPSLDNEPPPPAYERVDSRLEGLLPGTVDVEPRGERPILQPTAIRAVLNFNESNMVNIIPPSPSEEQPPSLVLSETLPEEAIPNSFTSPGIYAEVIERLESLSRPLNEAEDGEDISEFGSPTLQPHNLPMVHSIDDRSRKSSSSSIASSANYEEMQLEQSLPLLNLSTNSVNNIPQDAFKSRNSSIHSLLQDMNRRLSNAQDLSMRALGLVDADSLADSYRINGSLSQLRNPRIKKHYQEDAIATQALQEEENDDDDYDNLAESMDLARNTLPKLRQKSFGVVNHNIDLLKAHNDIGSEETLENGEGSDDDPQAQHRDNGQNSPHKPRSNTVDIDGFKLGYIIK